MHKKIELRAASEERLQVKLREVRRHLSCPTFTSVSQRQENGGPQGDSIHSEGF